MIGIIYKFTIVCGKVKKRNKCPFYIGQHWEKISVDNFIHKRGRYYYQGSGVDWYKYIRKLIALYPDRWCNFIHREVLYAKEGISQKALDVLEQHFIKKYKSHYSFCLGGCNILWGTANKFGSGSPMKDPNIAKRMSKSMIDFYKTERGKMVKKKLSEIWSGDVIRGEKNPNYGHRWTDEMKQKASKQKIGVYVGEKNPNYGNKWTDKMKQDLSNKRKDFYANGGVNPMSGKKRITNGVINTIIPSDAPLPEGFRYGMKKQNSNKRTGSAGCIYITDNKISKRVPKDSVIPEGWRRGIINSFNRYKYENQVIKS